MNLFLFMGSPEQAVSGEVKLELLRRYHYRGGRGIEGTPTFEKMDLRTRKTDFPQKWMNSQHVSHEQWLDYPLL